jgi:hypothetical protein
MIILSQIKTRYIKISKIINNLIKVNIYKYNIIILRDITVILQMINKKFLNPHLFNKKRK